MSKASRSIFAITLLTLLMASMSTWAQDEAQETEDKSENKKSIPESGVYSHVTPELIYQTDDSYRFGKYSGLTDKGWYFSGDFLVDRRPDPETADTVRWKLQGWRVGLDSRRVLFDYRDQGKQRFGIHYRETPNNQFEDGQTPYRREQAGLWRLAPGWEIAPRSSNTRGFLTLEESLVNLKADTKRRTVDLSYDRQLGRSWTVAIDYRHETKKGTRTLGSIFGFNGANPRGVILPAPVDWNTDIIEAMFHYATSRMQFSFGMLGSFFNNQESTLTFQNAYGNQSSWADPVEYPTAYGRFALEPDNSFIQFRATGGFNFTPSTRLTADVAVGEMKQNERMLDWSVNPELFVETPVPRSSLNAKVDTTMINVRLTSRLARRLGLRMAYRYDKRDNKTPRDIYPFIGADSEDQRDFEDGRINLPYSYKRQKADAFLTYRFPGSVRLKGGVEYMDYSRDYQEVRDSDELAWLAGISFRGWSTAALTFDYRNSDRDVSEYIGNVPLIESSVPGTVDEEDWVNHPQLRKYFLTDRTREEYRGRLDFFPSTEVNVGLATSYFKDDYDEGYFGLNKAKVKTWTVDGGWYPQEHIALTGFYTREEYDASQSARSFRNSTTAEDPERDWGADSKDKVDTYNVALVFREIGADKGWKGFELGFDFTYSDTRSKIDVYATELETAPLPDLNTRLKTYSIWAGVATGGRSNLRLTAERARLYSTDWGLDGVYPDLLANVLLLGQSAANYDLWLISGTWSYRF